MICDIPACSTSFPTPQVEKIHHLIRQDHLLPTSRELSPCNSLLALLPGLVMHQVLPNDLVQNALDNTIYHSTTVCCTMLCLPDSRIEL